MDIWGLDEELIKQFEMMMADSMGKEACNDMQEHDWEEYVGLTNKYEYCTKCDRKRDNV